MPGWKVVTNKVEMHTDGKPRVVRVCDVGVSKGCVFFLVGGLKMKVLKTTKQTKKMHSSRCTLSYAPRSACRDTKRQPSAFLFFKTFDFGQKKRKVFTWEAIVSLYNDEEVVLMCVMTLNGREKKEHLIVHSENLTATY